MARPAPPYFATCSTYRRQIMNQHLSSTTSSSLTDAVASSSTSSTTASYHHFHYQKSIFTRSVTLGPQSPASRPEDLRVKPWYAIEENFSMSKDSPPALGGDHSSYPVYQSYELDNSNHKETTSSRGIDASSTRTSSIESENPRASVPRKAYMDLNDAIAMLDETCPNQEASPLMTPRTPRTPLTPHPRNKRARSKSSDNSSNFSIDRLNDKAMDNNKPQEKERKRPFLKKIGISMTEDRPFLSKLAPRIIGKPYLEKIGPSRAVDKPFLEKIGSSRTLDKFTFDTMGRSDKKRDFETNSRETIEEEEPEKKTPVERRDVIRGFSSGERRRSGKNFLLKMYSFETEDLEDTSLAIKVPHRDPLRGASLDDVLDSGPSSMPRINEFSANSDVETPNVSVAELVKCRVTTSEEIISSNSCSNSPMEVISWGNSPKRRGNLKKYNNNTDNETVNKENNSNESVPNSPTKRAHSSITPEKVTAIYKELDEVQNNQTPESSLDKRKSRYDQFERRGLSSDNLIKDRVTTPVFAEIGGKDVNGKGSNISVVSSTSSARALHDVFDSQEIFTETYADFKRRTQGNLYTSNALKRLVNKDKNFAPSLDLGSSCKEDTVMEKKEGSPKVRSKSVENTRLKSDANMKLEVHTSRIRTRSVLRKQQGVDHSHYPNESSEIEVNQQRRKLVHEPSQETLNLLSELQKVKSLLKTPTPTDKTYETDNTMELKTFPKKILLTDKEFCLSIERENSIRRPSRVNTLEAKSDNLKERSKSSEKKDEFKALGPELFEKRCLSLDYADEEKSMTQKTEPRALSLASARSPRSEDILESSEIALITCDSKSYSSDVFNTPSDDVDEKAILGVSVEKEVRKIENEIKNFKQEEVIRVTRELETMQMKKNESDKKSERMMIALKEKSESSGIKEIHEKIEQSTKQINHYSEIDGANLQVSPKKKKGQSQTSDSFEIASPKATPFRMKKRLGRISVEETVKQESFTVNKVECKEVAVQKRAKCLPL